MSRGRRLASLDVLRGATVAAMIVVNNPGHWDAVFPPLQHAAWNGCTAADLVFPFFIAIMGVAIGLVFAPHGQDAQPRGAGTAVHRRVLTRAATLAAFGVLLNLLAAWPDLAAVRVPGVLQRIGITYAVTALLVLHLEWRLQLAVAVLLACGQWALLVLVPAGGHAAGVVLPEANVGRWLDRLVFGAHVLSSPTDPEGLIGIPTSVATALGGAVAAHWLRMRQLRSDPSDPGPSVATVRGLIGGGVVLAGIGLAWSAVWPFNKTLWTGSYAVFALGSALWAFGVTSWLVDRRPALPALARPFEALGTNALAVYIGSEFAGHVMDWPILAASHWGAGGLTSVKAVAYWRGVELIVSDAGGRMSSLAYALLYAAAWTIVAILLRRRGITLRI